MQILMYNSDEYPLQVKRPKKWSLKTEDQLHGMIAAVARHS